MNRNRSIYPKRRNLLQGAAGFVAAASAAPVLSALSVTPAAADVNGSPVLVELFTSQGCNSCPPAEAFMREIAPNPRIVVLEFHVDYWDYIGWRDPFANPQYTARQRDYAKRFNNRSVYTPQMVIDGRVELVGSHSTKGRETINEFLKGGRAGAPSLDITSSGDVVTVSVVGGFESYAGEIWVASIDKEVETLVRSGENSGKNLVNTNMVRSLERVGTWDGSDTQVSTDRGPLVGTQGIVAWVQQPNYEQVVRVKQVDWEDLA